MATTTNYGWDTPDDTDLVKDGALAMRDLGQDVDTTLFSVTNGANVGMVHLNTTSFTSQTAVQVNNVFSSSYDNYLLLLEMVSSGSYGVATQLCLSGTPAAGATDYRRQDMVAIASSVSATGSSTSSTSLGVVRGTRTLITSTIGNPAKALPTSFIGHQGDPDSTFTIRNTAGFHILSTAYDGIRISGFVGGTGILRIYGYRNS
jgi:hypothetical protein